MRVALSNKGVQQIVNALNGADADSKIPNIGSIIRGIAANRQKPLTKDSAADLAVIKSLSTGSAPGSYLVPTEQYNQLLPALSRGGILRRAGATVLPLSIAQKIQIPVEGAISDDSVYLNENAQLTSPVTPNIEQRDITLKQLVSIFEASANLARVSKPAFDQVCVEIMTRKAGRAEDYSFFAGKAAGPISIFNRANVSLSAQAGAALAYSDITNLMETAGETEDEIEKFVFFVNNLTLNKLRQLKSPGGNFILKARLMEDGTAYSLLGHRVFTTPAIPSHVGSGNATSFMVFANPANIILCDAGIEIAIADDGQYFDRNAVGVRLTCHREFTLAHPESICILDNIN